MCRWQRRALLAGWTKANAGRVEHIAYCSAPCQLHGDGYSFSESPGGNARCYSGRSSFSLSFGPLKGTRAANDNGESSQYVQADSGAGPICSLLVG